MRLQLLGTTLAQELLAAPKPRWTKNPLNYSVARSPRTMGFWGCLPPCKTGCRMARETEMAGGNRQFTGVEVRDVVPYLGRRED